MKTNNTDFVYFDRSLFPSKVHFEWIHSRKSANMAHFNRMGSCALFDIFFFLLFFFLSFIFLHFILFCCCIYFLFLKHMTSAVITLQNRWNFIQYFFSLVNWSRKMFAVNPRPLMCDCIFFVPLFRFVSIHSQSPSLFFIWTCIFSKYGFLFDLRETHTYIVYNINTNKNIWKALIIMWIPLDKSTKSECVDWSEKSKIGFLNYPKELLRWYDFE